MATIRAKELANGKRAFQVRWRTPDGIERSKQLARASDAKRFKAEIEASLARGLYVDPRAGRITFREYADKWLVNATYRSTSQRTTSSTIRRQINPYIGDTALNALRRDDVQAVIANASPAYRPGVHRVLATILNSAVMDELIPRTPLRNVRPPKRVHREIVIPTADQVYAVAGAMGRYGSLVMLAASSGLRRAELLAVRLATVDFDAATLRVPPDSGQVGVVGGPHLAPPKSAAGARTVPLGDVAMRALRERIAAVPPDAADGFGGLLWTGRKGPLHPTAVTDVLTPVMRAQGFPPRTGLHIFRHFYASALIAGGASVKDVQVRLGHASAMETLDTYGHLWPDSDALSRTAIDAALARSDG